MKPSKALYWTLTIFFSVLMLADGLSGLAMTEAGNAAMRQLGYPLYLQAILGVFKVLGGVAVLQNKFKLIREWAYAGFTFSFIGAAASWAIVGGPIAFVIIPLVMLALMIACYMVWKKYEPARVAVLAI
ncbi:DoxX family protein [Pseudoflavitalea sp. G-6-1-2]|uniref:DoxX family protein n=1 Tax=Pseudoflavitalea sp. G-6-1-2 TaxID=2728841 RepID=UPI00146A4340|nr:DoxX family protein [Pseudoflavitalea sp. G-6-1-2]NML20080.1 DoxX family protein [Pseudoflavitalea sp. G-6-1-2]